MESYCNMNFQNYPMDTQAGYKVNRGEIIRPVHNFIYPQDCELIIESWGYTSDRLSFHWDELLSDVKNGILNQQFVELIYKKSSTTEYSTGEGTVGVGVRDCSRSGP